MLTRIVSALLAVTLNANLWAQSDETNSVKRQIILQPTGSQLNVRLNGGEKIRGTLLSTDNNGFILSMGHSKAAASRSISYGDVATVTVHKPTHTPVGAWIALGVIVAAVVIVVAIFGIERHNERG